MLSKAIIPFIILFTLSISAQETDSQKLLKKTVIQKMLIDFYPFLLLILLTSILSTM